MSREMLWLASVLVLFSSLVPSGAQTLDRKGKERLRGTGNWSD